MGTGYSKSSQINEILVDEKMAKLSQTNVVLLIEYNVLAIMYYGINTLKWVLHI